MTTNVELDQRDVVVLLACLTVGAVVGLSLTGAAAFGTALGAAAGGSVIALRRRLA